MQNVEVNSGSRWEPYWEGLSDNQLLYREQAAHYVRKLTSALRIESRARVLDFGCGFGLVAEILAPQVGEILLWESSSNMRCRARFNVSGRPNVGFIDLSETKLPPTGQFDLILVNSVVQYMTLKEFSTWLVRWRSMLAPDGRIVVSDLIPANHVSVTDILDLLNFTAQRGCFINAIRQSMREQKRYWRMRKACPLLRMQMEELSRLGQAAGLAVSYLPENLTHFTKRITAIFTARVDNFQNQ